MSERIDNPPAFPRTGEGFGNPRYDAPGMTLRDWFAGQAICLSVAGAEFVTNGKFAGMDWAECVASESYRIADALLAARTPSDQADGGER